MLSWKGRQGDPHSACKLLRCRNLLSAQLWMVTLSSSSTESGPLVMCEEGIELKGLTRIFHPILLWIPPSGASGASVSRPPWGRVAWLPCFPHLMPRGLLLLVFPTLGSQLQLSHHLLFTFQNSDDISLPCAPFATQKFSWVLGGSGDKRMCSIFPCFCCPFQFYWTDKEL